MIRRLARILAVPATLAVVLAIGWRNEGVRRRLVVWFDRGTPRAAAANVGVLRPTIDGPDAGRENVPVELVPVVIGVPQPTDVAAVPGHPDRLVVLSKGGTAYLGTVGGAVTPWFTIEVATASELGLLGIAFHPDFVENGRFFVDLTPKLEDRTATRVTEWRVDPASLAGPRIERTILEVAQPYANHNGGQLAFGPDGRLYVALGDGGFRNDPHDNGQNLGSLLGKILRLDVDAADPVPADNPFAGREGARPEIWAWGLRNPWRFAFAPDGRMIVGDVGQSRYEEIDLVSRGDDLGWRIREADHCFDPSDGCRTEGLVDPIWSYGRDEGASVTGGVVATAPGPLSGRYVFGDFATGRLWALELPSEVRRVERVTALGRFAVAPSAFARAPDGGIWVADYSAGAVFRVAITGAAPVRP